MRLRTFISILFLALASSLFAKQPVIGIAWRSDLPTIFIQKWADAISAAGGYPVVLLQVKVNGDYYADDDSLRPECLDDDGQVGLRLASVIKEWGWANSNAAEVMEGIDGVVFTGGEDISTTLYAAPEPLLSDEVVNPTRDVSDYLLMAYCLDNDIPLLGVCRGMQVLAVVEGCPMIQDLSSLFSERGDEDIFAHRLPPEAPNRDFTLHDVLITDSTSRLFNAAPRAVLHAMPSWHHQAVASVDHSRLSLVAISDDVIEAIERPDLRFALGVQFHPEVIIRRSLVECLDEAGDIQAALDIFRALVNASSMQ